jgi:pyruvate dehydrogenase E1 component beta subunit
MTYKEELKRAMDFLGKDEKTIFIGYNVKYGSMANGTLVDIRQEQLIETPVAENLMIGMAIGLSLEGFKPVVYIERFDFIMCAMDALVNHLDKIEKISKGEFRPKVIIRCVVGNKKNPLYTGDTHVQDFTQTMKSLLSFPVIEMNNVSDYRLAYNISKSCMVIEYKDLYGQI